MSMPVAMQLPPVHNLASALSQQMARALLTALVPQQAHLLLLGIGRSCELGER